MTAGQACVDTHNRETACHDIVCPKGFSFDCDEPAPTSINAERVSLEIGSNARDKIEIVSLHVCPMLSETMQHANSGFFEAQRMQVYTIWSVSQTKSQEE